MSLVLGVIGEQMGYMFIETMMILNGYFGLILIRLKFLLSQM